jgi:hypothetical protein
MMIDRPSYAAGGTAGASRAEQVAFLIDGAD